MNLGNYEKKTVIKNRLSKLLSTYWSNTQRTYAGFSDDTYYLPEYSEIENFIKNHPILSPPNLGEGFDCDDYSFVLKGSLCLLGRDLGLNASICVGIVWGNFSWRPEYHACNFVVLNDLSFYWIEPKTGDFKSINECNGELTLILV